MAGLTERQVKYIAYTLVHKWAEEIRENGGDTQDEFDEVVHNGGLDLWKTYFGEEFDDNHELVVKEIDRVLSDLQEMAGKNDG